MRGRLLRIALTLVVTGLCTAYILWQIDVGKAADTVAHARIPYLVGSLAIMSVTVLPMAWRWQRLLAAKGVHDRFAWLTRAYFTSYTAGQVLPTAVGGDALRIYETSKRHPGSGSVIAGTVLLERALGGATTLVLAGVGFLLAVGHYDVGGYLWLELAFVIATIVLAVLLFARAARPLLARSVPILRLFRVERWVRPVYESIHGFREHVALMLGLSIVTLTLQAVRVLAIWLAGKSVGVDLSPRVYYVMGPLLFLVMLVPFTINGLAVRESFFVSFLTHLSVSAEAAFATGFVFFLVTVALSLPGAVILGWEAARRAAGPTGAVASAGKRR